MKAATCAIIFCGSLHAFCQMKTGETAKAPADLAQYGSDTVKIVLSTDKQAYRPGEQINVRCAIHSITDRDIRVTQFASPHYSYWMVLTNDRGEPVGKYRCVSQSENIPLPGNWSKLLRPGAELLEKMELQSTFEIEQPGRYHLKAWRFNGLERVSLETLFRAGKTIQGPEKTPACELEFESHEDAKKEVKSAQENSCPNGTGRQFRSLNVNLFKTQSYFGAAFNRS